MNLDQLKLGKLDARKDKRTIRMASILDKELPPLPAVYDFDVAHPGVDMPMFLNDSLGDCVIAGRAHMTRRLELIEQGKVITIKDSEVKREYFKESGGQDSGLVMLDSLNAWRKGWRAAGRTYTIDAYAQVSPDNFISVASCIYLLGGCYVGVALPLSAKRQMGTMWMVTRSSDAVPGSWGGHCIMLKSYDTVKKLFTAITWGAEQVLTAKWLATYADEAYGIVDNTDPWLEKAGINVELLNGYLKEISA